MMFRPLRSLLVLLLVSLIGVPCRSATDGWTGAAGDGRWSTAANWSTGTVPGADDQAVIGAGAWNILLDAPVTVGACAVDTGFVGTIRQQAALTAAGS